MQIELDETLNVDADEDVEPITVSLDLIAEDRAYGHRKCAGKMIGDATCYGCGETYEGVGQRVLVFNWQV